MSHHQEFDLSHDPSKNHKSWDLLASRASCQGSTLPFFEKRRTWRHGIVYMARRTFWRKMRLRNVEWWKICENTQKFQSSPHQSDRVRKKIKFQVHHLGLLKFSRECLVELDQSLLVKPLLWGPTWMASQESEGSDSKSQIQRAFTFRSGKQSLVLSEVSLIINFLIMSSYVTISAGSTAEV